MDARVRAVRGMWLASADTPDGPTLEVAQSAPQALALALAPFDGVIDELLQTAPREVFE